MNTRRRIKYVILAALLLMVVVGQTTHAQTTPAKTTAPATVSAPAPAAPNGPAGLTPSKVGDVATVFGGLNLWQLVTEGIAVVFNQILALAGWLLALSGILLNYSMNLTLHIHDFVSQTPAIYKVWTALRDISGLFFIFFLLYAAFMFIVDAKKAGFGDMVKNIVVAGVLINFSFFLTGLGIDASNVISAQIYNAIAPTPSNPSAYLSLNPFNITSGNSGGIADIFMGALRIPALYNPSGQGTVAGQALNNGSPSVTDPIKILLLEATAFIIMITAAISFTLASGAFVIRFVMLLFLLAFSPILFLSFVSSEVASQRKKWLDHYKSMLLFMPVYLLLMYLALSVLNSTGPLGVGNQTTPNATSGVAATASTTGGTTVPINLGDASQDSAVAEVYAQTNTAPSGVAATWYASFIPLGVNAVLVIFLLNLPLVVAVSIGGAATSWIDTKKWGAKGVWKWSGGTVGTHTIGAAAAKADKALSNTRLGNTLLARDIRSHTTGALAKNKMGSARSAEERNTALKDVAKKDKEIVRRDRFEGLLKDAQTGRTGRVPVAALKESFSAMGEKEKLALGTKKLKDPNVLRYLKKSDFDAIKKPDSDFTEDEKREIADARKNTFQDAVRSGNASIIKDMVKNYGGEDLLGLDRDVVSDINLVPHYSQDQLKKFGELSTDATLKENIREAVYAAAARPGVRVPTEGWMRKQQDEGNW